MATFWAERKLRRLLSDLDDASESAARSLSCYRDIRVTTQLALALQRPVVNKQEFRFQLAVIESLGEIGDPSAIEALIEIARGIRYRSDLDCAVYTEERKSLVSAAVRALGKIGDARVVPFLLDAAFRSDEWLRSTEERKSLVSAAVQVLGKIGDVRAVPFLLDSAFYSEGWLRSIARESLEAIDWQPKDSKQAVLKHLLKPDWNEDEILEYPDAILHLCDHIRRVLGYQWEPEEDRIIVLLGREGQTAAIDTLEATLVHIKNLEYSKEEKCYKVIDALVRIGNPRCVAPLAKLASATEKVIGDCTWIESIRKHAMKALVRFGETGMDFIVDLMHANPNLRHEAAAFLASIDWRPRNQAESVLLAFLLREQDKLLLMGDAAVTVLCSELDSHTSIPADPEFAAIVLGEMRVKSALGALVSAKRYLESNPLRCPWMGADPYKEILVALGKIGGQAAFEELLQVLGTHDSRYDNMVIEALCSLDGPRAIRPLLKRVHNPWFAKKAWSLLIQIVTREPQNIATADLEEIRGLDGLIERWQNESETFSGNIFTSTYEKPLDCSTLKNLAIRELARRKG